MSAAKAQAISDSPSFFPQGNSPVIPVVVNPPNRPSERGFVATPDLPNNETAYRPLEIKAFLLNGHEKKTARELFIAFLEDWLGGISFRGFQSGFSKTPDLILFTAPSGSTLAVPVDIMLQPRQAALAIIREKLNQCEARFAQLAAD